MMKPLLITLVLFLLNIFSSFAFNLWSYTTDPPSGSVLVNGENVTVDFTVIKQYTDDVYVFVRPFSGGALASSYGASGGVLISGSSGSGTSTFTIQSGVEEIDQIRFQAVDANTGDFVGNVFSDVDFEFVPHQITSISFDKPDGSTLVNDEDLNVSFEYASSYAGDVRVFAIPQTNGSMSTGGAFAPSGLEPTPRGTVSRSFTVGYGNMTVDQVKFMITEENSSNVLHERLVDVTYEFTDHLITNISFDKPDGSTLMNDEDLNVSFEYASSYAGDVRVFAIPQTNGSMSTGGAFAPSGLEPTPRGTVSRSFTVGYGDMTVDQVKFMITEENSSNVLHERLVEVTYEFTSFYVENLSYTPTPGSILQIDEFVDVDFGYKTSETGDFKIRAIPLNEGSETVNYDAPASVVYSSLEGSGSVQFAMGSGDVDVDQIRFEMISSDETATLGTDVVEVQFTTETATSLEGDINDDSGITVFPVPVRGNEFLLKSTAERGHYYLIGMDSKILSQGSFNVGENPVSVDNFPSGIYILRIVTEESEEIKKVVVQ